MDTHKDTHWGVQEMRTNIEIDAELVREAQELSRIKTKRERVHQALREFVNHRKRLDLRELEGSSLLEPEYDYKKLRALDALNRLQDSLRLRKVDLFRWEQDVQAERNSNREGRWIKSKP